ncbi:MAG: hypothetical protein QXU18_12510 [Thermoplasmatales archaeon]
MNRKLFALMMVPVIVVMGGTFAFSAWAGNANAHFGQTVATVGYTETVSFVGTNANQNPLTIVGSSKTIGVTSTTPTYVVYTASGSAASNINVYANVSYMVPGEYVEYTVTVTNTGNAVLNTSTMSASNANTFNGANQELNSPFSVSELQPPITQSYLAGVVQNGLPVSNGQGPIYLANATLSNTAPSALDPGQTFSYTVYAILPSVASTSWQGYNFYMAISLSVSVDP